MPASGEAVQRGYLPLPLAAGAATVNLPMRSGSYHGVADLQMAGLPQNHWRVLVQLVAICTAPSADTRVAVDDIPECAGTAGLDQRRVRDSSIGTASVVPAPSRRVEVGVVS